MTSGRRALHLENLLTDAALQALYMRPRSNDLADEKAGVKFIYGIDANVIRSWGNPQEGAARLHRVGRIFRSDDDRLASAIAWRLLNFIFSRLGPEHIPLLIIPPIEVELVGILEALYMSADVGSQVGASKTIRDKLQSISSSLSGKLSSADLADLNLQLQDLLLEEASPSQTLKRINLLFTRSEIAPLEELRTRLPEELRNTLFPPTGLLRQWYDISIALSGGRDAGVTSEGWRDRLERVGSWATRRLRDHDAEVLAKIEVWNRILVETRAPWRILYITADSRLFRAASQYQTSYSNNNFAECFLRHPHAYLSEEGVLGPVSDEEPQNDASSGSGSVGDWLALLTQPANAKLAHLLDSNSVETPRAIRDFADWMVGNGQEGTSSGQNIAAEIQTKWRTFAKRALLTDPFSGNYLDGLTKDLTRPVDEFIRIVRDLHEKLERDRRRSLRDYLQVTTRLGRNFELRASGKRVLRPVAPVFFEDWRQASQAIALMSRWSHTMVGSEEYQQAVRLLEDNDRTAYAFYLGHAAFFAARGRWASAALLARQARRIGQSFRLDNGYDENAHGAHGREAAFFEATCRRQLANKREDLDLARDCLIEANDILVLEVKRGKYSEFVDERISIESATIAFYDYMFLAFVDEPGARHADRFRSVSSELWSLEKVVEERLSVVDLSLPQLLGSATETRLRAQLQLLILLISLGFLPDALPNDRDQADVALAKIEALFKSIDTLEDKLSAFERLVLIAARLKQDKSPPGASGRRNLIKDIDEMSVLNSLHGYDLPFLEAIRRSAQRS